MENEINPSQATDGQSNRSAAIAAVRRQIQVGIEQANRGETFSHEEVFGSLSKKLEAMKANSRKLN
jgi:predicted transcriptional regulator